MTEFGIRSSVRSDGIREILPAGAVIGAGSYVAGYVLTSIFTVIDGLVSGGIPTWKAVAWAFYGAHNVRVVSSWSYSEQTESHDVFQLLGTGQSSYGLGSTVPEFIYMLVPVAVLLGAGYAIYRSVDAESVGTHRVVTLGGAIVPGYTTLTAIGAVAFEDTMRFGRASVSASPDLTTSILLMGLLYPVVLGVAGAVLAKRLEED